MWVIYVYLVETLGHESQFTIKKVFSVCRCYRVGSSRMFLFSQSFGDMYTLNRQSLSMWGKKTTLCRPWM